MTIYQCLGLFVAFMVLLSFAISDNDQLQQQELYCEMVRVHKESKGEHGWPAYKGEEICK